MTDLELIRSVPGLSPRARLLWLTLRERCGASDAWLCAELDCDTRTLRRLRAELRSSVELDIAVDRLRLDRV